ncbi:MAG: heme exporter protein CcmD [Betaproteobacteria bacterium]|nr:heme exporter protein CcmD [Betaproteobacteria bacterium]
MNWGSWQNFFAMGGYGLYVWGSYAVTLVVLVAEIVELVMRRRGVIERLGKFYAARRRNDETEA